MAASASDSNSSPSRAEAYGYGVLATLIICLLSVLGMLCIPCLIEGTKNRKRPTLPEFWNTTFMQQEHEHPTGVTLNKRVLSLMLGMAVATLFGDAVLHLFPFVWGLHQHGDEGHDAHADEEGDEYEFVWKGCAVLAAAYAFYTFQLVLARMTGHAHHHQGSTHMEQLHSAVHDDEGVHEHAAPLSTTRVMDYNEGHHHAPGAHVHLRARPIVWLIIFGDAVHNFVDGLALGAAFNGSITLGLSTAVAVACHELPHEIGDFAVLLDGGWSVKKAVLMNFGSSLTALIGLFIGLESANSTTAQTWILAVAAGLFVYIAFASMIPEMIEHVSTARTGHHAFAIYVCQFIGLCIGTAVMILLARFEEDIDFS